MPVDHDVKPVADSVPSPYMGPKSNIEAASPFLAELTMLLKEYVYMVKSGESFTIKVGRHELASFCLKPMPGCCGVVVSTGSKVHKKFQGRGVGTILNRMRFEIARYQQYSAIICTDLIDNIPQRKILAKNGWKDAFIFKNKKTQNNVALSYYILPELEKPVLKKSMENRIGRRERKSSGGCESFMNYDTTPKTIPQQTAYDAVYSKAEVTNV